MTTLLIIAASIFFIALIVKNLSIREDLQETVYENKLLQSSLESERKKYEFQKNENMKNFFEITELKEKSKKWDAELERQRIKAANYRAKKQLSKINK